MKALALKHESSSFPGLHMLKEIKATYKKSGFRGLRKKYGWKVFAAVIAYYLIRDLTIYVIIPYLIIDHV
ncbi:MAG TPA: hypothetical protein VF412_10210 [Bdellovibrio sp.]|uniref:hypothetical protein n=1 Tax=Bdellovibrio sp. TaxID=28201 RepID=UPI002EEB0164